MFEVRFVLGNKKPCVVEINSRAALATAFWFAPIVTGYFAVSVNLTPLRYLIARADTFVSSTKSEPLLNQKFIPLLAPVPIFPPVI